MAKRVDKNQSEIVRYLREYWKASVFPTHMVGGGFPDIVVGFNSKTFLIEIKSSPNSKLTTKQQHFIDNWQGNYYIVSNTQDVDSILENSYDTNK